MPWTVNRALLPLKRQGWAQRTLSGRLLIHPSSRSASSASLKVALRGDEILAHPQYNKGTAFSAKERTELDLTGKLPYSVDTLDLQLKRAKAQYDAHESDIRKNTFLQSLRMQNWTLFYALLTQNLKTMMPIIYTPTEADVIASYSHLFRRPEGLYLSPPMTANTPASNPHNAEPSDVQSDWGEKTEMERAFLSATAGRKLELIVVSDGEAILGIGDQGSGGIGISSAKAALYTLIAGVDPGKALPVVLDVGTNSDKLRKDELYLGWDSKRLRGDEYYNFVDQFVELVKKHQPQALLHFEDFGVYNAQVLLNRYRKEMLVFNDDIQGTGAVTLAALMVAVGVTKSKLSAQRYVCFGAGTAGVGIARQIRDAIVVLEDMSKEEASSSFWLVDKEGLLTKGLQDQGKVRDGVDEEFIRQDVERGKKGTSLEEVVKMVKPTVLIGTSTAKGAFTEEIVREMKKHCEHPIIFPLSNPTRLAECDPADAAKWTDGTALLATGSPFDPVDLPSGGKAEISEANNALVYPGIGMGAMVCQASRLTDEMLIAGVRALAQQSPCAKSGDWKDGLLPDFKDSPAVNFEVALGVIKQAMKDGVSDLDVKEADLRKWLDERIWRPKYVEYEFDPKGEK